MRRNILGPKRHFIDPDGTILDIFACINVDQQEGKLTC